MVWATCLTRLQNFVVTPTGEVGIEIRHEASQSLFSRGHHPSGCFRHADGLCPDEQCTRVSRQSFHQALRAAGAALKSVRFRSDACERKRDRERAGTPGDVGLRQQERLSRWPMKPVAGLEWNQHHQCHKCTSKASRFESRRFEFDSRGWTKGDLAAACCPNLTIRNPEIRFNPFQTTFGLCQSALPVRYWGRLAFCSWIEARAANKLREFSASFRPNRIWSMAQPVPLAQKLSVRPARLGHFTIRIQEDDDRMVVFVNPLARLYASNLPLQSGRSNRNSVCPNLKASIAEPFIWYEHEPRAWELPWVIYLICASRFVV